MLFHCRNGTPLTTNNVRRRLRGVMDQAGIEGGTALSFRRTVATVIDRAAGADLAAELFGHTSSKITEEHFIQPDEAVDPVTAEILGSLAPKQAEEQSSMTTRGNRRRFQSVVKCIALIGSRRSTVEARRVHATQARHHRQGGRGRARSRQPWW